VLLSLIFRNNKSIMKKVIRSKFPNLDENQVKFIYAVSRHETGNFTSLLSQKYNNLFGMRPSYKRNKLYESSVKLDSGEYAVYNDPVNSIADFVDWFNYHGKPVPDSPLGGVMFMKSKGYFEDSSTNYYNAVKKYFNN